MLGQKSDSVKLIWNAKAPPREKTSEPRKNQILVKLAAFSTVTLLFTNIDELEKFIPIILPFQYPLPTFFSIF